MRTEGMMAGGTAAKRAAAGMVAAALAASCATVAMPAAAMADATGATSLVLSIDADDLNVGGEGTAANLKVTFPVKIAYEVDADGNLEGTDVAFRNNSVVPLHVAGIHVTEDAAADIVKFAELSEAGQVALRFKPGASGTEDEFGNYVAATAQDPAHKEQWNVPASGSLTLTGLEGKIQGFGSINAVDDVQVGTVHWKIAAGKVTA